MVRARARSLIRSARDDPAQLGLELGEAAVQHRPARFEQHRDRGGAVGLALGGGDQLRSQRRGWKIRLMNPI